MATLTSNTFDLDVQTNAFNYIGIPYPTDPVPAAIMPTLPTGADFTNHEWIGTYDPVTVTTPTPPLVLTENVYIVNTFDPDSTNIDFGEGDNSINGVVYGSPSRPRDGLPTDSPYPAGTKIFVYGDNTPLPTTENDNWKLDYTQWQADAFPITFNGTSSNICWVIGIDKPRIGTDNLNMSDSTHIIWDGIYTECKEAARTSKSGNMTWSNCDYSVYRNGGQYGWKIDNSGNALALGSCEFHLYYNNELAYFGGFNTTPGIKNDKDSHAWRPSWSNRWLWCIGNEIHHIGADATQIGNSSNTIPAGDHPVRSHYTYFAGNNCYHLKENMFDCKNSYHAFCVENTCDETEEDAIILPNNNEGPLTGYHWAIANQISQSGIHGLGGGIRGAGDQVDNYAAALGNVIIDVTGPSGLWFNFGAEPDANSFHNFSNNTIVRCNRGFYVNVFQPAAPVGTTQINSHGNIFYDCTEERWLRDNSSNQVVVTMVDSLFFDDTYTYTDDFTLATETNSIESDPGFNNPTGRTAADFVPNALSAAINGTTEPEAYQRFQDMYGLDIRKDILGNTWLATDTNINIGAIQDSS